MSSAGVQYALKPEFKAAASSALLLRGCVNVIGLDGIRAEAGPRWPKLQPSIYAHLESLLRQKLGPTDFFVQMDETTFMVTMPSASMDEAQVFCVRVAHELHTNLLGKCDIGQLRIARAMATDGDAIELTPVTGDNLVRLAADAGLDVPVALKLRVEAAKAKAKVAAVQAAPEEVFRHQFIPLWDAQKEAITTYACVTIVERGPIEIVQPGIKFKAELAATRARLHHAATTLARHLANGERFLMSVPVSYDMLSSPIARMEISGICRNLSSELRPYLLFEISELPYGVPQSRLTELIGALRPFCRAVSAQLAARVPTHAAYQNAGLQAIGLSLANSGIRVPEIESEIFRLVAAAKRLHLRSFVADIPTADILQLAYEFGANVLSGPLIGVALDDAAPIMRLPARDIPGMLAKAS